MSASPVAPGNPSGYVQLLAPAEAFPPLKGTSATDVAVIGGGLAGLNVALSLAEAGEANVVVLEAESFGFGASGRNAGFVFGGYSLGEGALLHRLGPERARRLYRRTSAAVDLVRSRIRRYGIACDFVDAGVIWANWFRNPRILRRRQALLREAFGVEWEWLPRERMRELLRTDRYSDGLFEPNAMHINPLAYVRGLARAAANLGVRLHEDSRVLELRRQGGGWRVRCAAGELEARRVVLACGGYRGGLVRRVDRAVLPIATYAMLSAPLGARVGEFIRTPAAVYDTRFAFDYYRVLPDTRLLWGGRISVLDRPPAALLRLLRKDLGRVFPQLADVPIATAWSGLMSYARHEMPQLGTRGDGLYWAQAFGGHGLAPTTAAGQVVAEALLGDAAGLAEFAPFGLASAWSPLGFLAAQACYAWLQGLDAGRALLDGQSDP